MSVMFILYSQKELKMMHTVVALKQNRDISGCFCNNSIFVFELTVAAQCFSC